MSMISRILLALWGVLCSAIRAVVVGVTIAALVAGGFALADYSATQGSGTTFASLVISTKHYMAMVICDATAGESQCSAVDGSGNVAVKDAAAIAAIQAPVPACSGPPCTTLIGLTSNDVCAQKSKTTVPFSTTSGGPVALVAVSGSTTVYICSISAITDTAIKLSFIDGTGTACAAATHAIWGSTTAANGMSLAANGGFTEGSGSGTVGSTAASAGFCLLQSGTSLVAGNITFVQQ